MNLQDIKDFVAYVDDLEQKVANLTDQANALSATVDSLTAEIEPEWLTKANNIIASGRALMALKIPYKFGGNTYAGFDCSFFMQTIFAANGIQLPRVSNDQAKQGVEVAIADIRPGDLIAFDRENTGDGKYDHIGLSLGGNQMLHTANNVTRINICDWTTVYKGVPFTIRRVIS